jgi:hypothetical protein
VSEGGSHERPSASATFAAERVPGSRRPPILLLGWVLVLGGIVALGLSGRAPDPGAGPGTAAISSERPALVPTPPPVATLSRRFDPAYPSLIVTAATEPGPIQFEAVRSPSSIAVHGTTNTQQVARVLVSVQSLDGRLAGSTSTRIRGPYGDGADHLPPQAFVLSLPMPARIGVRVVVVEAAAYSAGGELVASARVWLEPES